MKRYITTFLISILFAASLGAHNITGSVFSVRSDGKGKEPLPYAFVYWLEKGTYVEADENGKFSFNLIDADKATLVATAIGYQGDTLSVDKSTASVEFILMGTNELEKAVIVGRQEGNYLSKITPIRTEIITAAGLCKMACCNLAESFENSASVTVGYADAVTGARQIRLLGLSGIYTQMLDENRPVMRGLASPFGLSYIPGQWLESIQIAKGPSSVINGSEAITGQINMEHRKPNAEQALFANLFLSNMLRTEANIATSFQLNDKWSTIVLAHFSTDPKAHDGNGDGFRDEPRTMQFNLSNRWLYTADNGIQVRLGVRALSDDRLAGQMDFTRDTERSVTNPWGSVIKNKGINTYVKLGIPVGTSETKSFAVVADYTYHDLDSFFGLKDYKGKQNSAFVNLMYQNIPNDNHRMTFGISNQYDNFNEKFKDWYPGVGSSAEYQDLGREENTVGVYGEYTYTLDEKFTGVIDLRLDYNNIYGVLFAPRANVKYSFTDNLVVRASGGRGFRSPNVIVDNMGMLSTSRRIVIDKDLDIEDAWTYGGNITAYLNIGHENSSYLSFDYFRTDFNKQVLLDQERDLSKAWLYNLDGRSYTNTYQVDFAVDPIERFNIIATFRYTDAKVTLEGQGLVERPMTSKYKGVLNLQYATRMNIWTFDFTAQINGPTKLPYFIGKEYSPVYPMFYLQVTRKLKGVDVYVGVENLANYTQPDPILGAADPFGKDFNSSLVWGPLMGRKIYAGLRWTIWK